MTDEYGNLRQGSTSAGRYGWLGTAQRSADNPGGLITVGVRNYNPVTGRFLSTDSVYGGNNNAYDYAAGDPVNKVDLSGAFNCWTHRNDRVRWTIWGRWVGYKIRTDGWCHFTAHDIDTLGFSDLGVAFLLALAHLLGQAVGFLLSVYRTLWSLVKAWYDWACTWHNGFTAGLYVMRYYNRSMHWVFTRPGYLGPFCT